MWWNVRWVIGSIPVGDSDVFFVPLWWHVNCVISSFTTLLLHKGTNLKANVSYTNKCPCKVAQLKQTVWKHILCKFSWNHLFYGRSALETVFLTQNNSKIARVKYLTVQIKESFAANTLKSLVLTVNTAAGGIRTFRDRPHLMNVCILPPFDSLSSECCLKLLCYHML